MSVTYELKPVLEFLRGLRAHNNRAWFERNRGAYETAKGQFEAFVALLIEGLGELEDLHGISPKDCVTRIYRDVRFSADKSPYRTSMGAHLAPGGRKSPRLPYYLHIAADDGSLIAGGLYMPTPVQLVKFRQAIDRDAARFRAIIKDAEFKRCFRALEGEKVKTAPKGYPRDHPEIDLLRFKQVMVVHHVSDAGVTSAKFPAHSLRVFAAMKPFLDYLNADGPQRRP
jgi:uncharacterized protein (TIGR02453 family)